ncbi:MAG: XTP/dITP diphosphatase [Desulfobulbaceae bacterium]|jgi:XTP/dITP diphosphohydrolase|nr:XTP/dITP diphosphatase [Desulfobulbaceae bacterium]
MIPMIVLATGNQNKVKEFQEILAGFPVRIASLKEFPKIPEAVEDGKTFKENAYKKALHTAKILGLPAIADDSGLCVDALDGEPGVYSARYAGEMAGDDDNCQKLLAKMEKITNRRAHFTCVISIAVPSGPALTYEDSCQGEILREKRGVSGFGYDPLFWFPSLGKSFAELSATEKNRVSHRGKALAQLRGEIDKVLTWLEQRLAEEKPAKPDHSQFTDDWSGK